ncbi:CarD family transcriptional regulator, partial [Streptococcus pyogenes]
DKALSRIETLQFLRNPKSQGVLIVSLSGLRTLLPNPDVFTKSQIQLTVGEDYDSDTLTKQLMTIGYQKVSQVISPGEFSRRGDILDIYEITQELPYRLEFFGDDIDSIRQFHPETQKSFEQLEGIFINPASDLIFEASDFQRGIEQLEKALQTAQDDKKSYLEDVLAVSKNGFKHKDIRKFQSLFYEKEWSLLDYIPKGTPIFFDDFQKLVDKNARFDLEIANLLTEDLQQGKALSNLNYFTDNYRELRHYKPATFFSNFHKGLGNIKFDQMHQLTQYAMQEFFNQFPLLIDEIKRYQKNQTTVIVQVESQYAYKRLEKSFQDYQFRLPLVSANQIVSRESQIVIGAISSGFYFADEKLALITEREIYHKKIKRRARRSNISNAERLKDYNELAVGDYVVHNVHGIGRFLGIETIQIQGIHRDYVTIQYQNSDRISLPIDQIGSLSKYVSADGKEPKINKLNDGRFQKTKQKVARQVEDIADDLLKLYAERSQQKGFSFSPDDDLQRAFDDDFAFVETEDQL